MKKARADLYQLANSDPAIYNALSIHLGTPDKFTFEDALIAIVCYLSAQNRCLSNVAIVATDWTTGIAHDKIREALASSTTSAYETNLADARAINMIGKPITRAEALRMARAILEQAEQERRPPAGDIDPEQLALGKHNLSRWATRQPRAEWAQALLDYIAELEQVAAERSMPPEIDWEQAPMDVR